MNSQRSNSGDAVVSGGQGFLPETDPLESFDTAEHNPEVSAYLNQMDELARELPALLDGSELRPAVAALSAPDGVVQSLSPRECRRLCLVSGFLASAYVHDIGNDPVDHIPTGVAVPLYECSQRLDREPMLAYDVLCLHNFRRETEADGLELTNLDTLVDFTTHRDERWFVTVHIAIEAAAGPGLAACRRLHEGVRNDERAVVLDALETIHESVTRQTGIMNRMHEHNDPETFAREFRPYYDGFDGIVYEGVDELDGEPQHHRGGSGAQSLVLPSVDAALGIDHGATGLTSHLDALRTYMPDEHLAVVDSFERGPEVRPYVTQAEGEIQAAYNDCVEAVAEFRTVHFGQTMAYIRRMTGDSAGTGGTDYESFLQTLQSNTEAHTL
ncbi:indoleamine 2,3-dioxygenase [Halovenus aranensis]|uniref:Indoleamine 2,3-dioxygenase n=1 Tax=Halovenus aranensis TaxID=890420 RepID=A0A1G8W2V3_9EURY|nr:indoleamine 2,3-dioxygenase [Halovenus aranensis]SDJ72065.1 indoleamine 2,3-dioxygenase [Halovenus aranensis]